MIDYVKNIKDSKLSIYEKISPTNTNLYIPTPELKNILSKALINVSTTNLPLRTRSKFIKSKICEALGYPIPTKFYKVRPRFFGQNFDVYTQQSLNVQIWNDDIDANRRYVFVKINEDGIITKIRIINGEVLSLYDKTGTLTTKYQATMHSLGKNICSSQDTENVKKWTLNSNIDLSKANPNNYPRKGELLNISEVYKRLLPLVGTSIDYINSIQNRNRGAKLQEIVCKYLGYSTYRDDGKYPDIKNQLIEIKLQTSSTIDLGLYTPWDNKEIITPQNTIFYTNDIRYAIFDSTVQTNNKVFLKNLYLVTGRDFISYFKIFKNNSINQKIQITLPKDFFYRED